MECMPWQVVSDLITLMFSKLLLYKRYNYIKQSTTRILVRRTHIARAIVSIRLLGCFKSIDLMGSTNSGVKVNTNMEIHLL